MDGGSHLQWCAIIDEETRDARSRRQCDRVLKLLSEDPASYSDAPREAIRRVLESVTGIPHPIDQPLDTSRIEWIRMGTTVATNALLERKGERTAFVTTIGFKDLLHIGNQSRQKIFDLVIARPDNVYERVVEVHERVMVATAKESSDQSTVANSLPHPRRASRIVLHTVS